MDGYTLTVNGGIKVANNHSLTIYGQSGRTGKLTATTEKTDGRYAGIGGDMNSKFGSGPVFPCFVWRPKRQAATVCPSRIVAVGLAGSPRAAVVLVARPTTPHCAILPKF